MRTTSHSPTTTSHSPTTTSAPEAPTADVATDLTALLDEVARTDLGASAWEVLARRARAVTVDLADRGLLPQHLVVAPSDPPVVTARLLSAARHHATAAADVPSARAACA